MKHFVLWMFAVAALTGSALQAQNLAGNWQGTLDAGGQKLRIVLRISLEDDKLKATLFAIDQPAPGRPASTVTKDGSTVKIAFAGVGGYEGKLSGDGNSLTGSWTQAAPIPLILTRATPATAWTIPEPPPPQKAMRADVDPVFEVATIKPSAADEGFSLLVGRAGGNTFSTTAASLRTLVQFANGIHPRQVMNGPAWLDSEKYDITGKPEQEGIPSIPQLRVMVRKLLEDRFKLVSHREKKELSVYAITIAKGGPKLTPHQGPAGILPGFGLGRGLLSVQNSTMAEFAGFLQAQVLDQPVVDQTGLTDRFDFSAKYTPDASQLTPGAPAPPVSNDADAPPDLFTAFQQQLGLKLESTKAPVDVVVIDKVEKPSDN